MNLFQKILQKITFGAYNPEKKFEQEVLGEGKTNLEEKEKNVNDMLKSDISKIGKELKDRVKDIYEKFTGEKEMQSKGFNDIDKENIPGFGTIEKEMQSKGFNDIDKESIPSFGTTKKIEGDDKVITENEEKKSNIKPVQDRSSEDER